MTLADLERFVTGPAIYRSGGGNVGGPAGGDSCFRLPPSLRQKRKPGPDSSIETRNNEDYTRLYRMTLNKLLASPAVAADSRRRVEPSLEKFMFLRSLVKQLQHIISNYHSCCPSSKRISLDIDLLSGGGPAHDEIAAAVISGSTALSNLQLSPQSSSQLAPIDKIRLTELYIPAGGGELCGTGALNYRDFSQPFSKEKSNHAAVSHRGVVVTTAMNADMESSSSPPTAVITRPTELVDSDLLSSFDNVANFQTLVQCSMDHFGLKEIGGNAKGQQNADELDNIMQVLVSM